MVPPEVIHSFLEEKPINRETNGLENHICVRFIRRKYRCFIIFFLCIIVLAESIKMVFDKLNLDNLDISRMFLMNRNFSEHDNQNLNTPHL